MTASLFSSFAAKVRFHSSPLAGLGTDPTVTSEIRPSASSLKRKYSMEQPTLGSGRIPARHGLEQEACPPIIVRLVSSALEFTVPPEPAFAWHVNRASGIASQAGLVLLVEAVELERSAVACPHISLCGGIDQLCP